jgi:hypothetical protein
MLRIRRSVPNDAVQIHARVLEDWRLAAELVSSRWQEFRAAAADDRAGAFAAYVAALDAEAMVADRLACRQLVRAA